MAGLKYLDALEPLSQFETIKGKFQLRIGRCYADCRKEFQEVKEKKTDVNIALRMIHDYITDPPNSIILISSDSDLEPAVQWVHRQSGGAIDIMVYLPNLPDAEDRRRNDFYQSIGVNCEDLPCGRIPDSQLPSTVRIYEDGKVKRVVQRPAEWAVQPAV